jgi:hypothetical protein
VCPFRAAEANNSTNIDLSTWRARGSFLLVKARPLDSGGCDLFSGRAIHARVVRSLREVTERRNHPGSLRDQVSRFLGFWFAAHEVSQAHRGMDQECDQRLRDFSKTYFLLTVGD